MLGKMRTVLVFLGLLSFCFSASKIELRFGPGDGSEPTLDQHFIAFVEKAQKTLDGSFFEFRLDSIVDALIRAHNRGVKVRLVTDDGNYYLRDHATGVIDREKMNPFAQRILDAGIDLKQDNDRSGLMHNKFAIVDSEWVWTGSYNLTDSCSLKNENNAIWLKNEELAKVFTTEFEEMFVDGLFGVRSPSQLENQTVMHGNVKIEVLFGPEDNPMGKVEEYLADAKESIYFMEFAMTHDNLGEVMVQKHHQGLKVRGIFDRMLYRSTGPYAEFSRLTAAGVPVVVYDSPHRGKMHHKVFIIDAEGSEPKVAIGSGNASANGNKANDENVVIIHDAAIAKRYLREFRSLFGKLSRVMATFHNFRNLKPGTRVPRLSLIVSSNGVATQKLKIQFPPRWPMHDESVGLKIYRLRKGKQYDTTSKEDFKVTQRDIQIESANLTKDGESSVLVVKVTNALVPEIPGGYNLYIQAKAPNTGFYPLTSQPVVYVGDTNDIGVGPGEFYEDAVQILGELTKQNFTMLQETVENCQNYGICDLLEVPSFVAKVNKLLQQLVNVNQNAKALEMLETLKAFQPRPNRAKIFEQLYVEPSEQNISVE
jgi:phosphatidylserine/phosphatidylglycerophosphate/cardiolipin synthase-like enzyme